MFEQLDFSRFHNKNTHERDQFCRELISELSKSGWVRLVNHGVPPESIDRAFEMSREFFELPLDQKLKSPHPPTAHPHRGFSPVGLENISSVSNYRSSAIQPLLRDMKVYLLIGYISTVFQYLASPGLHDGFRDTMNSFFTFCYEAELMILDAISIGLGLPIHSLRELHGAQTNELRLTHYPEVDRADFANATRIAAHTDFGTITLLFQDNVGGLGKRYYLPNVGIELTFKEMEQPPGSGVFVPADNAGLHECIVNVGDCLQIWTGLHSARHRVHLAKRESQGDMVPERFSIAYFAKPDRAALLRPLLDSLDKPTQKLLTANEFQHMRIEGTYA
ncbi:Oxoglutarate/iron-dependent dioxygenase [Penicillium coprophilum]|uniref:Oxoglutarate/iron-dependent dioxygenase n=1 Tax=Penicillium coprophilum TaxID=36646 RepID=UPI00238AAAE3|nr:Oxoglutarate/iron-dependent dioxygenase [Penicillium coprophilum]KAJ5154262.1 Oxoglutarate/iron-dependent dioxygenase [Penicillium coprophilum]